MIRTIALMSTLAVAGCGGGILVSQGVLTINDAIVANNRADDGGGIANVNGTIRINQSTIKSNTATGASGLSTSGTTQILNSTISGNTGTSSIHALGVSSNLTIGNSTISGNQSGIRNQLNSTMTIEFSTIYGNVIYGLENDASVSSTISSSIIGFNGSVNCLGEAPSSGGYNVVSDASCLLVSTDDLNNIDPLVDDLANNGGRTQTHAPQPASAARDLTPNTINGCGLIYVTDQRGFPRPNSIDCDSGASEG